MASNSYFTHNSDALRALLSNGQRAGDRYLNVGTAAIVARE
jgi:hypothetical protein